MQLKLELKECKDKLAKYQGISDLINIDCVCSLKNALENTRKIHKKLYTQLLEKSTEIVASINHCISQYIVEAEERRLVIEELAKSMSNICLPASYKYLMWAAKNNSGVYGEDMKEHFNLGKASRDEWNTVVEQVEHTSEEFKSMQESKEFFLTTAAKFTELLKRFIECNKEIQLSVRNIDSYVQQRIVPKFSLQAVTGFFQWLEKVFL